MINYTTYRRTDGTGFEFGCLVRFGRDARLFFGAATEKQVMEDARKWVAENFDTPERQQMLEERRERIKAKREEKTNE